METFLHDVRFAGRMLRRSPGFALVSVLSLALATGAATAIFSIVNAVLLRPLPFASPDRLMQVYAPRWGDRRAAGNPLTGPIGFAELAEFGRRSTLCEGFAGYYLTTRHLQDATGIERLTAAMADANLFSLLGVRGIAGRVFRSDDPADVVVISASLWRRRFNQDASIPGQKITLDGRTYIMLGVMADTFQFPYGGASMMPAALSESRTDVWMPFEPFHPSPTMPVRQGRVGVVARLKAGASIDGAAAELGVIAGGVDAQYRDPNRAQSIRLVPLADEVVGPVRRSLWMLVAAVGLVLAAACANVANLLLARMTARVREVVTRAALGASHGRLVRQLLTEGVLLSIAGGLSGALVARISMGALLAAGASRIPRAQEIALDWQAFAFLAVLCLTTVVLFGLAPALAAARVDVQTVTKESGGHATMGRRFGRMRDGLVIIEVALAFVLALGATLVMQEVNRLQHVNPGMATENVIALHLTPRASAADYYAIEERVAGLPGVLAAGFTQLVPLQNWGWEATFTIKGRPVDPSAPRSTAGLRYVTPGYFRTLGIPLVRGRAFTTQDQGDTPHVILINAALARQYFPGEDPLGRETDRGTIVGITGDVRNVGLDRPEGPEIYYPAAQNVTMASDIGMSLLVHTDRDPVPFVDALRSAVRDVNPNLAVFNVKTMAQVVADSLWELTLYRWLIGLFALLALMLLAIGLYGVISCNVTLRLREFAVRLALGSDPLRLARLVLARAMRLAMAGLAGGVLAALALTQWMRGLTHVPGLGVISQPGTSAAIATVLLAIALLASIVPAMRIARVNPAQALRRE
jgi:putative ABC transport system permease protein